MKGWPVASVDNFETPVGGTTDPIPAAPIHALTHRAYSDGCRALAASDPVDAMAGCSAVD